MKEKSECDGLRIWQLLGIPGLLNELVLGALFIVHLLQGAVELKQEHDVVKVFHEFLVVDLAIPVDICKQV